MFERISELLLAGPLALDRALVRLRLWAVHGQLRDEAEFADAAAAYVPAGTDEMLGPFERDWADATSEVRFTAYWRTLLAVGTCLAALAVVLQEASAVGDWWERSHTAGPADTIGAVVAALTNAGVVLGGMAVVANVTVLAVVLFVLRRMFTAYAMWFEDLSAQVRPALRLVINAEASRSRPTELLVGSTPGLSGQDLDAPWIERAGFLRIRRLILELGATSVAVSGRRGVGKTTLLRRTLDTVLMPVSHAVKGEPTRLPPLSVVVQAPVDYAPKDFLIDLFAQLCETVIEEDAGRRLGPKSLPVRAALRAVRFVGRIGCAFGILALLLVLPDGTDRAPDPSTASMISASTVALRSIGVDVPPRPGLALLGIVGLAGVFIGLGMITKPGAGSLARRAETELAHLRYLQTLQSERALNLSRGLFGLGLRRARQLAQQPVTLPELVRRYRDFAQEVAEEPLPGKGAGLLLAIDEMDRIASAASAELFLNQIKATFDVPGCVYLVSISEDALAQFERRISTLRTTVDTSFDEVVWLPAFSLAESMELLRRRVTGFPDLFLALCFCLSGGVPRDLLRAARSLVDARRDAGVEQLGDLVTAVVRREVEAFGRGVVRSLAIPHPDDDGAMDSFLDLVVHKPWTHSETLVDRMRTFAQEADDANLEYSAVLAYYATIEHLFLNDRETVEAAVADPADPAALLRLEDLAAVRSLLPVSPRLAIARMDRLRQQTTSTMPARPKA